MTGAYVTVSNYPGTYEVYTRKLIVIVIISREGAKIFYYLIENDYHNQAMQSLILLLQYKRKEELCEYSACWRS